jgi:hypothetical protein
MEDAKGIKISAVFYILNPFLLPSLIYSIIMYDLVLLGPKATPTNCTIEG